MGKIADVLNNPAQVDKVTQAVFNQVDTDHSGYVSEDELEALMSNIASQCGIQAPTKDEVHQAMQAIDKNSDGKVSVDEFRVLVVEILRALAAKGL